MPQPALATGRTFIKQNNRNVKGGGQQKSYKSTYHVHAVQRVTVTSGTFRHWTTAPATGSNCLTAWVEEEGCVHSLCCYWGALWDSEVWWQHVLCTATRWSHLQIELWDDTPSLQIQSRNKAIHRLLSTFTDSPGIFFVHSAMAP